MVMDWMRECYITRMVFGDNSSRADLIRWYWADPKAKNFPYPTPFVSRNWDQWEIWPDIGEMEWAARVRVDGDFPIPVAGQGPPCGDPDIWRGRLLGTPHPIYPRNMFGLMACCGGLIAPLGQPTFGLQVQIGPSVEPVPPPQPFRIEAIPDNDWVAFALASTLVRKPIYPPPWVPKQLAVDSLDDSNPQKQLIFGEE